MSSLIVPLVKVDAVKNHPNADSLDLIIVGGWQVVVRKGSIRNGDELVFFPPDTIIPRKVAQKLGVEKYLSFSGEKGRVSCIKLRGEVSFGFVVPLSEVSDFVNPLDILRFKDENDGAIINLCSYFQAEKYYPPVRLSHGEAESPNPNFSKYTDIENLRHYPSLMDGLEVVITEKIHGQTLRIGYVLDGEELTLVVGSSKIQRKKPKNFAENAFWYIIDNKEVMNLLDHFKRNGKQIVVYGESYGSQVQSLHYDSFGGRKFRAFDIMVDGKYLNHEDFIFYTTLFKVETVPCLYKGIYNFDLIKKVAELSSSLNKDQIREGVVVKSTVERRDPKIGRVILKYISDNYLFKKEVSDFTEE